MITTDQEVEIRVTGYATDAAKKIQKIRYAVFSLEQGVDPDHDQDGRDPDAVHVLALAGATAVGTGRMLKDGHIGRVAVLKSFRGLGIGGKVVQGLVQEARAAGMTRVFLGAQVHALSFYQALGFQAFGKPFEEAGIRHIHMEKTLSARQG